MKDSVKPDRALCAFIAAHRGGILQTHAELTAASHTSPPKYLETARALLSRKVAPVVFRLPGLIEGVWVNSIVGDLGYAIWQSGDYTDAKFREYARGFERKITKCLRGDGLDIDFKRACTGENWVALKRDVIAQPLPPHAPKDVYPLGFIGK